MECRSLVDGYEGFVPRGELDDEIFPTTHRISSLRGFAYTEANYKSPPVRSLSFMSPLSVFMEEDGYALLMQGGWIPTQHIKEIGDQPDPVDSAMQFLGTPYLWGGRTSIGLDCSALVQLSLLAAGHDCPRDSKDQKDAIGQSVDPNEIQRGDLVFFEGHVGIMVNENEILNATSRHMTTLIEPLETLVDAYGGIETVRRV